MILRKNASKIFKYTVDCSVVVIGTVDTCQSKSTLRAPRPAREMSDSRYQLSNSKQYIKVVEVNVPEIRKQNRTMFVKMIFYTDIPYRS